MNYELAAAEIIKAALNLITAEDIAAALSPDDFLQFNQLIEKVAVNKK